MTPPKGRCVWCGGHCFNREHVIAKQVARAMDLSYPIAMHWGDWQGSPQHEMKIVLRRRVCKTCNGGWMRDLDSAFLAMMHRTLKEGAAAVLNPTSQTTVALWATKVALLLELYLHDRAQQTPDMGHYYLPDDNFTALYQHKRPAPRTQVWLGAVDLASHGIHVFSSQGASIFGARPNPKGGMLHGEELGFRSIFNLRELLFCVYGWRQDRPQTVVAIGESLPPLKPLWPPNGSRVVTWPTNPRYTRADLVRLSEPVVPHAQPPEEEEPPDSVIGPP